MCCAFRATIRFLLFANTENLFVAEGDTISMLYYLCSMLYKKLSQRDNFLYS